MGCEAPAYAIGVAGKTEAGILVERVNELKQRAERCRRIAGDCGSVDGAQALELVAVGIEAELDQVLSALSQLVH